MLLRSIQIHLFWVYNFYWEMMHPTRPLIFLDSIQNAIRIFSTEWFTPLPVLIFFMCGQLIVVYFEVIKKYFESLLTKSKETKDKELNSHEIIKYLQCMKQLYVAIDFLHRRFGVMLMVACFMAFINLLTSSFYFIHYINANVVVNIWDAHHIVNSLIRFWIMGDISDRMRMGVPTSMNT